MKMSTKCCSEAQQTIPLSLIDQQKIKKGLNAMKRITGIKRLEESTLRLGGVGDNWHMTWPGDDRQYFVLCDGPGWSDIEGYPVKTQKLWPKKYLLERLEGI